jgi:hypothetical protein
MDPTVIRVVCAAMAVIFAVVLFLRRKSSAE